MALAKKMNFISPEEYLEGEKISDEKHDYINGQVFLMAGASDAHVTVVGNIFSLLHPKIREKSCKIYISDMKVFIETANCYFYPDIFVTCDVRDRKNEYFKKYPNLIIEVLSESTGAFDRGKKFSYYRELKSLQEYVLIDSNEIAIDSFRRNNSNEWVLSPSSKENKLEIKSFDTSINIEEIYDDVEFAQSF